MGPVLLSSLYSYIQYTAYTAHNNVSERGTVVMSQKEGLVTDGLSLYIYKNRR